MFSLVAEFLAFILLLVLAIHLYERERVNSYFAKKFWRCLLLAVLSVLLNALTVLTIAYARAVPLWLNMLVNSTYFLVSYAMTASFAQYLFEKLLSHVYDGTCIRRATWANRGLLAAAVCVTVLNLSTGLVFYFDENLQYRRGPLNGVGYIQVAAEAVLLIYCYLRHRGSVDAAMKRVVRVGVPVTALLVAFQQMYPGVLLNGTMGAFMAIILFINFQSQMVEVDAITQLGNRSSFLLELEMQLAARQSMQVILVSLCQFGAMNLAYGYETGDEILYEIAHWLDGERGKGKVFCFSPVTFAMLQPTGDREAPPHWTERILDRFKGEWNLGDSVCRVPARVLDMDVRGGRWTVAQIVECLKFGQMRLKQEDRGYLYFNEETARNLQRRKYLADCLRRCIAQRTVEVWYQPVYCSGTGAFCSAEALVRLRDGDGGVAAPGRVHSAGGGERPHRRHQPPGAGAGMRFSGRGGAGAAGDGDN